MRFVVAKLKAMLGLALMVAVGACGPAANSPPKEPGFVDEQRLLASPGDTDNWLAYGRTYEEQRFSPLTEINAGTVKDLGLAFTVDLDTNRGQEATPIVVDGVMYFSTAWSHVYAVDAATGKVLWTYDPVVDGKKGVHACCDVVNRGVAVWKGKVFVGTVDGRLIAISAATGKQVWSVVTVDQAKAYTITGAPRVFRDKVIIGNSGAEYGVRGYVTAYDTATGKQVWRFYTVPGNPADGPDGAASDKVFAQFATKTWAGEWWKNGGGGTVWDSMVYDPEFNQILIGVGNGSPWNHRLRSAGKGDNLFLSSILALDPDTGAYKWHYQETPAETWDFTATQQMTLADLKIGGVTRKVVMQAPKNGFFYVLDRSNGKLISAEPYVTQNWAERIDLATGRPVERPGVRFENAPKLVYPAALGGHNWMPMSYSPLTGLVYIPAMKNPVMFKDVKDFKPIPGRFNLGITGSPVPPEQREDAKQRGWLVAWDPVKRKVAWEIEKSWPWNGGTLATAGNLVFQGDGRGAFRAHDATNGRELWKYETGRGVLAGPISYRVKGVDYIAVLAGYGGAMGMFSPTDWMLTPPPPGRLLVFKLGGKAKLAPTPVETPLPFATTSETFPAAMVEDGRKSFGRFCSFCHVGPVNPNLFRSPIAQDKDAWNTVVIGGALSDRGMVSFSENLTPEQAEAIRAYVLHEARARRQADTAPGQGSH